MKFPSVDFFRGLAVLMVLFVHSNNYFDLSGFASGYLQFAELGQYGVQLFFVLSAFTLCNSFQAALDKADPFPVRNFYIRRFFRIYPLYFLVFWAAYFLSDLNYSSLFAFLNLVFLNNYYPPLGNSGIVRFSWTLNVEMSFYLIFPFLFVWLRNQKWIWILPVLVDFLAGWGLRLARSEPEWVRSVLHLRPEDLDPFSYKHLWMQLSVFFLGFVFYHAVSQRDKNSRMGVLALAFAALAGHFLFGWLSFHFAFSAFMMAIVYLGFGFSFSGIPGKWIRRIGVCSYSIYLLHYGVIWTLRYFLPGPLTGMPVADHLLRFLAVVLVVWFLAEVTLRTIENPGIELGRKWIRRLNSGSQFTR